MAQIIDIRRVEVGPKTLTARVRVATSAPLMTSDDLEGTARVYRLLPHIIDHVCLGDSGETFKDVMGDTELAHLLEHVTVELLAQTNLAGATPCGRTYAVEGERRTFDVEFPCPDDVLVAGALSSAEWIVEWAYNGGGDPEPDVEATVAGLVELVGSLPEPAPAAPSEREWVAYGEQARALAAEAAGTARDTEDAAGAKDEDDAAPEPAEEAEEIAAPAGDGPAASAGATTAPELADGQHDQPKDSPEARQASQDEPAEFEPSEEEVAEVLDELYEHIEGEAPEQGAAPGQPAADAPFAQESAAPSEPAPSEPAASEVAPSAQENHGMDFSDALPEDWGEMPEPKFVR